MSDEQKNFEPQEAPEQEPAPEREGWETISFEETALLVSYRPYGAEQQFLVTAGVSPGMIIGIGTSETDMGQGIKALVRIDATGFDAPELAVFFQMLADKLRNDRQLDVTQEMAENL